MEIIRIERPDTRLLWVIKAIGDKRDGYLRSLLHVDKEGTAIATDGYRMHRFSDSGLKQGSYRVEKASKKECLLSIVVLDNIQNIAILDKVYNSFITDCNESFVVVYHKVLCGCAHALRDIILSITPNAVNLNYLQDLLIIDEKKDTNILRPIGINTTKDCIILKPLDNCSGLLMVVRP